MEKIKRRRQKKHWLLMMVEKRVEYSKGETEKEEN